MADDTPVCSILVDKYLDSFALNLKEFFHVLEFVRPIKLENVFVGVVTHDL